MDSEISSDIKFNLNKHDVVVINATGLLNIYIKGQKYHLLVEVFLVSMEDII
jgi:hypothetical protein